MDYIGIDVHKKESQICVLNEDGEVVERRIRTEPRRFADVLGEPRPRANPPRGLDGERVGGPVSGGLGHEVIVADPNFAPMYATRTRQIKTDRRDARALAEACRLGAYRPAHRLSDAQRHVRARLTVRDALVRTRTGSIAVLRAPAAAARLAGAHGEECGGVHPPVLALDLRLRFDVFTKTKQPEHHRYSTTRDRAATRRLFRLAAEVLQAIAGVFHPNPGWHCKDCPFRSRCWA